MSDLTNIDLNVNDTVETYSGIANRCMCGCSGSYNKGQRARKMAITTLLKSPNIKLQKFNIPNGVEDESVGCIYLTTESRHRVLYLNESGMNKVLSVFKNEVSDSIYTF